MCVCVCVFVCVIFITGTLLMFTIPISTIALLSRDRLAMLLEHELMRCSPEALSQSHVLSAAMRTALTKGVRMCC